MTYITFSDYIAWGSGQLDDDSARQWLQQAEDDVNTLTFGRIVARGFDSLTTFQQDIVRRVVCQLADFKASNQEALESVLSGYSINGVSVQYGENATFSVREGVAVPNRLYALLMQTGLCSRRLA